MKDAPKPGDVLGEKFRVERVLGEGGMGIVVAATHLQLGQLVALKFMLPEAIERAENVARFEREARAAVRLKSEHVARVSDVGRLDSGAPYMVMEFLEGDDLDRILELHGPLETQIAVDYVLQACEAVAEAHALGIVHRDLKPKNLFVTKSVSGKPLVKVLDFGISKISGATDMSLTSTAQILGSPSYMSPEQLRGARDVDQRCDIWALGTILYELTTGALPFTAESVTQLTAMVVADPPQRPNHRRADFPAALEAVIMKCLEKRREDRYQSIGELAEALIPCASSTGASKGRDVAATTGSGRAVQPRTVPPASASSSVRVAAAGVRTDVAWDQTEVARKGRWSPWMWLVVAALLGGGALAVIGLRPSNDSASTSAPVPEPTTPSPAAASATGTTSSAATAAPSNTPDPVSTPEASLSGAPNRPVASTSSSAPAIPRPPPHVIAKPPTPASAKKPPPRPGTNDLPDVRD